MRSLFQKKLAQKRLSAFTLLELVVVLGISGVLMTAGVTGFLFWRDSISTSNTLQSVKTIMRDTQDKALTFSAYNSVTGSIANKDHWVYGYTMEYDSSAKKYKIFTIVDNSLSIPRTLDNTVQTRTKFASSGCLTAAIPYVNFVAPGSGTASCTLEKSYPLDSPIAVSAFATNPCNLLFTTVNGKTTIQGPGNPTSCAVQTTQNLKKLSLTYVLSSGVSNGTIKICNGLVSICP